MPGTRASSRRSVGGAALLATTAMLLACGKQPPGDPGLPHAPGAAAARPEAGASASSRPPAAASDRVDALYGRCVQAMLQSTCRVHNDRSTGAPVASTVFVAGVGPVDAASYQQLRESGEAMCSQVKANCGAAWDGAPCFTARALWSGGSPDPSQ